MILGSVVVFVLLISLGMGIFLWWAQELMVMKLVDLGFTFSTLQRDQRRFGAGK